MQTGLYKRLTNIGTTYNAVEDIGEVVNIFCELVGTAGSIAIPTISGHKFSPFPRGERKMSGHSQ